MNKTTQVLVFLMATTLLPAQVIGLSFKGLETFPTDPNAEVPGYFIYETKPGETIKDQITIKNSGDSTMSIRLYGRDTTINNQGKEVLRAYTDQSDEHIAQWIDLEGKQELNLELQPMESRIIDFSLNIPSDANYQTYNGGILVESVARQDPEELADNVSVKTNNRIGIKTFVTVTDNPRVIKKLSEMPKPPTPWTQIYFYISLGLFIVVIGAFGINALRKKRKHHKK